ncbi:MAG: hypothetical protein ACI8QD_002671 [Cyclobacteriaceae bacterium]
MHVRRFLFPLIIIISHLQANAQTIELKTGFVQDSMQIGESVDFWISAQYPPRLEVIFPDSISDFSPFEYIAKNYQPTSRQGEFLYDSAVYQMQSFEIDAIQSLAINVVVFDGEDSFKIASPADSLIFRPLAPAATDTLRLLSNSRYLTVPLQFNYPMLYIVLGILAFVLLMVAVLFGKRILRAFKIRRLNREYQLFNEQLAGFIRRLKENPEPQLSESALIRWKGFMEYLEKDPYTKLTSSEILSKTFTEELTEPLKSIDRVIYGSRSNPTLYKSFQSLEDYTQHRFQVRINALKDGSIN